MEGLWSSYWEAHPDLLSWHSLQHQRRAAPSSPAILPQHPCRSQLSVVVAAETTVSAADVYLTLKHLTMAHTAFFIAFSVQKGELVLQYDTEATATLERSAHPGVQWTQRDGVELLRHRLHLRSPNVGEVLRTFGGDTKAFWKLFAVFGPCRVTIVDPSFSLIIDFVDPQLAVYDAAAALACLQRYLMLDWEMVLSMTPKMAMPTTAVVAKS
jgi:hypothetical protein